MKTALFLSLALLLLVTNPAYSLGKTGHKLVCQMAYDLLPEQGKMQVDELISQLPEQDKHAINKYLYQDIKTPINFASTCIWADAVKKHPEYESFKNWHFINVKRNDTQVDPTDCESACVTRAIEFHHQQLTEAKSVREQQLALMFLGHWLGDIHQPLHVSFKSDWGGNKNKLTSEDDRCTTLHWYWDSCIIEKTSLSEPELLTQLTEKMRQAPQQSWRAQSPWRWATESLEIVIQPSFSYCQIDAKGVCRAQGLDQPITLASDYQSQYWPVMEQRLLKAAVRLAEQLQTAL